jgi:hypothetical protein
MGLRESFFAIPPEITTEPVVIRGEKYFVRALTVGEKDKWELENGKEGATSMRARLVVATVCDESGAPVFKAGDVHRLADYPVSVVEPLVDAALKLNRITKEDVEELEKN